MLEQELKLTATDRATLEAVSRWEGVRKWLINSESGPIRFLARYHDTPQNDFENNLCALRSRLEGDIYVAALKMPGQIVNGVSSRIEYECAIPEWLDSTEDLPSGVLREKALEFTGGDRKLITTVEVDMMRTIFNLDVNGTRIEMVTDTGIVSSGSHAVELLELELELKEGSIDEIVSLGDTLRSTFDLELSTKTKYEIGIELWKAM